MVTEVVVIHTVEHLRTCRSSTDLSEMAVQLAFAGIATIGGIAAVTGIFQFCCHHLPVLDTKPYGLLPCLFTQMGSQRW